MIFNLARPRLAWLVPLLQSCYPVYTTENNPSVPQSIDLISTDVEASSYNLARLISRDSIRRSYPLVNRAMAKFTAEDFLPIFALCATSSTVSPNLITRMPETRIFHSRVFLVAQSSFLLLLFGTYLLMSALQIALDAVYIVPCYMGKADTLGRRAFFLYFATYSAAWMFFAGYVQLDGDL